MRMRKICLARKTTSGRKLSYNYNSFIFLLPLMYNVSNSSLLMMGNSDDDSHSPSRGWIHELRNRKAGNSNDEVIKGSLHLDSLTEDKVRSLMSVIIEFNPDMKEVIKFASKEYGIFLRPQTF